MLRTENWSNPIFSSTFLDVVYELGWAALISHPHLRNAACKYTIKDIFAIYTRYTTKSVLRVIKLKIFSLTFQYEMT